MLADLFYKYYDYSRDVHDSETAFKTLLVGLCASDIFPEIIYRNDEPQNNYLTAWTEKFPGKYKLFHVREFLYGYLNQGSESLDKLSSFLKVPSHSEIIEKFLRQNKNKRAGSLNKLLEAFTKATGNYSRGTHTPQEVVDMMVAISGITLQDDLSDLWGQNSGILTRVIEQGHGGSIKIFNQISSDNIVTELVAVLLRETGLQQYNLFSMKDFKREQTDVILSNPPFSLRYQDYSPQVLEMFGLLYGPPPKNSADWAFVQMAVRLTMKRQGKGCLLMAPGALTRKGLEQGIREKFVRSGLLKAICLLPARLFSNTNIPVAMLCFDHQHVGQDVLFIDGSTLIDSKLSNPKRNVLDLDRIRHLFEGARAEDNLVAKVPLDSIQLKSYSLGVQDYIQYTLPESQYSLADLETEILSLHSTINSIRQRRQEIMADSE